MAKQIAKKVEAATAPFQCALKTRQDASASVMSCKPWPIQIQMPQWCRWTGSGRTIWSPSEGLLRMEGGDQSVRASRVVAHRWLESQTSSTEIRWSSRTVVQDRTSEPWISGIEQELTMTETLSTQNFNTTLGSEESALRTQMFCILAARRFSHSWNCFLEVHRRVGGRTNWEPCMRWTKVRVEISFGQHPALEAVHRQLRPGNCCLPSWTTFILSAVPTELVWFTHCSKMHFRSTPRIPSARWQKEGVEPGWREARGMLFLGEKSPVGGGACQSVERRRRSSPAEQGIKILGTPFGHPDFVRNQLQHVRESSWALVLHCPATLANYYIRVVPRVLSDEFATFHDNALWICASRVLVKSAGHTPWCLRQKREGRGLFAAGFWWHGTPKGCPNGGSSLLAQLGRRAEYDFTATQNSGYHSRARNVRPQHVGPSGRQINSEVWNVWKFHLGLNWLLGCPIWRMPKM